MPESPLARTASHAPNPAWRVAIIDSGLDPRSGIVPAASRQFDDSGRMLEGPITSDPTGHGTSVAEIVHSGWSMPGSAEAGAEAGADAGADAASHAADGPALPSAGELFIAQVMCDSASATPAAVAAAIHWALERGARLIHLSLGLTSDRPVLATAVAAAVEAGVMVVASTPARGDVPFPARYPKVLRATGDARCNAGEISVLDATQLTFGACATFASPSGRVLRGASIGAAHLTRFIASRLAPGVPHPSLIEQLSALAAYRGRERRAGNVALDSRSSACETN